MRVYNKFFSPFQLKEIYWADTIDNEAPITISTLSLLAETPTSSNVLLRQVRLPSKTSPRLLPDCLYTQALLYLVPKIPHLGLQVRSTLTLKHLIHSCNQRHLWSLKDPFLLLS